MQARLLSSKRRKKPTTALSTRGIAAALGLVFSVLLFGCSVQQQRQFLDATFGALFGKGRSTDEVEPAAARPPAPQSTAPASQPEAQPARAEPPASQPVVSTRQQVAAVTPALSEAEQLFGLWQRVMTEHPQPYLDCLNNPQCRPALTGYLAHLQQQASRSLDLPSAYDPYDLKKP
jgi:hypothetical protein